MATSLTTISNDYESTTWALQSFAILNDFKSPDPATLLLDRANDELGLMYQTAPGVAVMAQFSDTDEPIYFQVSKVRAACTRFNSTCKKVCVLMQHFQLDLVFATSADVTDFLQRLRHLATKVGNLYFEVYEAASNAAIARADFNMEKEGHISQITQSWRAVPNEDICEWARIYKTGKCSDFTIQAGSKPFPAHRVLLSTRSQYFNQVCDGHFTETEQRSITLPESEHTVSTMLQEIYEVYNPTTGSIFINFALRRAMEKDRVMQDLLALFIACDKYNLASIKQKSAGTLIDRLPFIHDSLSIVDLASCIYDDNFPQLDCGLRKAIIVQVYARLSAIMDDEDAWAEYSGNKAVLKALHVYQCGMINGVFGNGMVTPPTSPTKR